MMVQLREGGGGCIRREMFYKARSGWENWLLSAVRRKGVPNE